MPNLFTVVVYFDSDLFFFPQCLRPPMNGEAFALSTSLSFVSVDKIIGRNVTLNNDYTKPKLQFFLLPPFLLLGVCSRMLALSFGAGIVGQSEVPVSIAIIF